jgi:hypothetical protein
MGKKQFTIEQIISKLREAEISLSKGSTIAAVCRSLGITEQTYLTLAANRYLTPDMSVCRYSSLFPGERTLPG